MKQIAIALLLSVAANAHALTNCSNAKGTFSFDIFETAPTTITVTDKSAFSGPAQYLCNTINVPDTHKVTLYRCSDNNHKEIAIIVNETLKAAQYQDLSNENNEQGNLTCVTR